MSDSRKYLDQVSIDGLPFDLWTRATLVEVVYHGTVMTLADAMVEIYTGLSGVITPEAVDAQIAAAIGELVNGAPETGDTLKELCDLIGDNKDAVRLLNDAIGKKVDKVEGKGLSTEDFTVALKSGLDKLLSLNITSKRVATWDGKAEKTVATPTKAGLMSASDKAKLDAQPTILTLGKDEALPAGLADGTLIVRGITV